MGLTGENYVRMAQYHHRRGIRMLKCARGVETCSHRNAFLSMAMEAFEARGWCMQQGRAKLGRERLIAFEVVCGFEVVGKVAAKDTVEAANWYADKVRAEGLPLPEFIVVHTGRAAPWPVKTKEAL